MKVKKSFGYVPEILRAGGVGVLPTDTLYGLCGSALSSSSVRRIYTLRTRDTKKPLIVLIGSVADVRTFGVRLTPVLRRALARLWPGKVSIVLRAPEKKFSYLHRGTKTIAFRLPRPAWLRALLKRTGPLAAPSANREGHPPALTVRAARKYFGDRADFYVDHGKLVSKPSTLVKIERGKIVVLREGAVTIPRQFIKK